MSDTRRIARRHARRSELAAALLSWTGRVPPELAELLTDAAGELSSYQLRRAMIREAHESFDRLWQEGHMTRTEAYAWLAGAFGRCRTQSHVGRLKPAQLKALAGMVEEEIHRHETRKGER